MNTERPQISTAGARRPTQVVADATVPMSTSEVSLPPNFHPEAVVIGASAGALEALTAILPNLPRHAAFAVLVVVHLPPDKESIMAELFKSTCQMEVCEAEDKAPIKPGTIYFAPPDYHLLVETDRRLSLSSEEPVHFSRPSIDVMFDSAADAYDNNLLGIVLTGANHDGAQGLKAICKAGGTALVQCPEQAHAPEMPQAALAACPSALVLSLAEIAMFLQKAAAL